MRDNMIDRIHEEAEHIIKTKCTIRECAKKFNISKTTVGIDMSHKRLKKLNGILYQEVHKILEHNYNERTKRGGEATKAAYLIRKRRCGTNTP